MSLPERIVVHVPEHLSDDISEFVEKRRADITRIYELLDQGDYDAIRIIGHNMKGNGALYHLNAISLAGEIIENASIAKRGDSIREYITTLSEYLDHLDIIADLKEGEVSEDITADDIPEVRALLVDDSDATRNALKSVLEVTPVQVVGEADNGHDAMELCATLGPQLVLLDVLMPGVSGLEVLEAIKQASPDVTVVMITSISGRKTVLKAKELGARDYILKPFDRSELVKRITKLCKTMAEENQ